MTPTRFRECLDVLHRCPRCGETKTKDDFPRNRANASGRGSHCRSCVRAYQNKPETQARRLEQRRLPKAILKAQAYRSLETTKARQRQRWRTDWPRVILYGVKLRCRQRGIEFALRPADVVIPDICPILGEPFDLTHTARRRNTPSLDRVNPQRGYVPGNVRVISWYANRLKSDCDVPEIFEAIARYIRENNQ